LRRRRHRFATVEFEWRIFAPKTASTSEVTMRRKSTAILSFCLCLAGFASADTLKLTNGQVIYGVFMGRNNDAVQFLGPDGTTRSYPLAQVATLTFGPIPSPAQQTAAAVPPPPLEITVPTGSFLLIRMSETLDTSTAQAGQLFTATLATNLAAQGYVVARQGTIVYGQVVEVSSARRMFGKSKITLQLTQIVINGTAIGITTDTWDSEGKSSGARTARRTLGGAGLGAGIGALAGNAGEGAAIGALSGVFLSGVQRGNQVQIPAETQLDFTLQQPVTLPVPAQNHPASQQQ
jgi:hypothetical protein